MCWRAHCDSFFVSTEMFVSFHLMMQFVVFMHYVLLKSAGRHISSYVIVLVLVQGTIKL